MLIPKENRKDLREVPRRVLRSLRIVLLEHMDDVLREALVVNEPDQMFGERRYIMEYRGGEFFHQELAHEEPPESTEQELDVPPPRDHGDGPDERPGAN